MYSADYNTIQQLHRLVDRFGAERIDDILHYEAVNERTGIRLRKIATLYWGLHQYYRDDLM